MKKYTIALLLGCASAVSINGQEVDSPSQVCNRILLDARYTVAGKNGGITPQTISLRMGYKPLPKLGVFTNIEGTIGLGDNVDGYGHYYGSNSIGGGLSYQILNSREGFLPGFRTLDIHATCGTTIGHRAWKYNLYEAGVTVGFWNRNSPVLGVGYRILHSRSAGVDNHKGIFLSIGFRM